MASPRDRPPPNPQFKFKCTFSGTIADSMKRRGWTQVEDDCESNWDIFWCDLNQLRDVFSSGSKPLNDYQRVGHFRNCMEISRKNLLVKNLKKLRCKLEKAFGKAEAAKCDFFPTTYILPSEHRQFVVEFRNHPDSLWIIKPAAGAQGRGIFIFKNLRDYFDWRQSFDNPVTTDGYSTPPMQGANTQPVQGNLQYSSQATIDPSQSQLDPNNDLSIDELLAQDINNDPSVDTLGIRVVDPKGDAYVVQRYITNPYLIGGRKFDIRFYVLVTSFIPLKAWIYREGFARFSAGQFSLEALQDVYIHLTNVAIQRTSEDYNPEKGSKWSLQSLREYLTARHGKEKVQRMFNLIDVIIIRTLQSVNQSIVQDRHCFEVYGFDVLIDKELYPWLLEVNASPAYTPSNEEDYILKCGVIDDTASVLDLEGRLTGYEKRVGGYDLIWNDGPVYANPSDSGHAKGIDDGPKLNSFLGCRNDRVPQLRDVYRNANFIKTTHKMLSSGSAYKSEESNDSKHSYSIKNLPKYPRKMQDLRFRLPEPNNPNPN